jgi:hypothetical protein
VGIDIMKANNLTSQNLLVETKITFGRQTAEASYYVRSEKSREPIMLFLPNNISGTIWKQEKTSNRDRKSKDMIRLLGFSDRR